MTPSTRPFARPVAAVLGLLLLAAGAPIAAHAVDAPDCGLGEDIDAHPDHILRMPFTCDGHVEGDWDGDHEDFYRFEVPERSRVVFNFTNHGDAWLLVDLYDPSTSHVTGSTIGPGETRRVGAVAEGGGNWTLRALGFGWDHQVSDFHMDAHLETAPPPVPQQDDCGSGADADHAPEGALRLAPPTDCVGTFARYGDIDRYGDDRQDTYIVPARIGQVVEVNVTFEEGIDHGIACISGFACSNATNESNPNRQRLRIQSYGEYRYGDDHYLWLEGNPTELGQANYTFEVSVRDPPRSQQTVAGELVAGAAMIGFGGPHEPAADGSDTQNVTHQWIRLDRPARPLDEVTLKWEGPAVLGVRYYYETSDGMIRAGDTCTYPAPGEARCPPPDGVAWASVKVLAGGLAEYEFTYSYWEDVPSIGA